jgi:glycosyltransferase involved in cell wall biosynthesis
VKILFVIESLTEGGKERRLTELMKALKLESSIEFELAVMSFDVHYKEVLDLGINVHYLIRKRRKDFSVFRKLYKLCKRFKPDIVHCWDSMTAVYITPVCKLLRIKLVNGMVIDTPQRKNIFYQPWLRARLTFPFADLIIGNSKAGLEAYNAPGKKSMAIYNGFNFERIKSIIPKEIVKEQLNIMTKYVVGMVATFSVFKDYSTYFNAAQIILNKRNDITFLAIGEKTDSDLSKSYIDEKYMDHFKLLGSKSGIESYINIMDIGVLSTYTEGISNSILEYMALEKPVVATSGGGTVEIIEDQKTGFLVSPSNPKELAEKILILLDDSILRMKMGKNGKDRIHKAFSIDIMTLNYLSTYKRLLSS